MTVYDHSCDSNSAHYPSCQAKKTHNPEQGLRLALSKGSKRADSPFPLLHLKTEEMQQCQKFQTQLCTNSVYSARTDHDSTADYAAAILFSQYMEQTSYFA